MVAASKNFRTKRKQRQVISAQFSRNSAASAALRATQCRGVQSNNNFASSLLRGENRNLDSQGNPDSLHHATSGFRHPCLKADVRRGFSLRGAARRGFTASR